MKMSFKRICVKKNSSYVIYQTEGVMQKNDISVNLHYDPDFAVLYMKRGEGILRVEGNSYCVTDGDIVITTPQEIHRYEIENGVYQSRIILYVNQSLESKFDLDPDVLFCCFNGRARGVGNVIPSSVAKHYKLDILLDDMLALAKQNTKRSELLCTCRVLEILSTLCEAYDKKTEQLTNMRSQSKTVIGIIEYINENLSGDISIEKIAKEFFLSKSRIEHLFKECTGLSMWDYIILHRLILCNEYIKNGATVKEASYQSGFCNYSNFYRLYKKHMGMTPSEYKEKCKEV